MRLSNDLVSQFAKMTKDDKNTSNEETFNATVVKVDDAIYTRLDGSDRLTPVSTTAGARNGERVIVSIKNHSATIIGNTSSPSVGNGEISETTEKVNNFAQKISEFETVIVEKADAKDLDATNEKVSILEETVDSLQTDVDKITTSISAATPDDINKIIAKCFATT